MTDRPQIYKTQYIEPDHDELVRWHKSYSTVIAQLENINRTDWTAKSTLYVVEARVDNAEWCPVSSNASHKRVVADEIKEIFETMRPDLEFRIVEYDRREIN